MTTTRRGKIARLPKGIRHQLNCRLEDGEAANTLVEWLNGLPEVREELADYFGGQPINEQNITNWREGGYLDWQRHQEALELVKNLNEQTEDLTEESYTGEISDQVSKLMAVELAQIVQSLAGETADPLERWEKLKEILPHLAALRRGDHRAARLEMKKEEWEQDMERREQEEREEKLEKAKQQALDEINDLRERSLTAKMYGGGELGYKMADKIHAIKFARPGKARAQSQPPGPEPIKHEELRRRTNGQAGPARRPIKHEKLKRLKKQNGGTHGKTKKDSTARKSVKVKDPPSSSFAKATKDRPRPNGFPSPPQDGFPIRDSRFARRGPPGEGEPTTATAQIQTANGISHEAEETNAQGGQAEVNAKAQGREGAKEGGPTPNGEKKAIMDDADEHSGQAGCLTYVEKKKTTGNIDETQTQRKATDEG